LPWKLTQEILKLNINTCCYLDEVMPGISHHFVMFYSRKKGFGRSK